MLKLQYSLLAKKDMWFSPLPKGIFSESHCYGYELYCIVGFSLCEECDFALAAF